jgi:tetratricopeptide (TPR) repeat protein
MGEPTSITDADLLAEKRYEEALAAFRRGDNDECRRISEAALEDAIAAGSERGQALSHLNLSRADFRDRDYAAGIAHAKAADAHALACRAPDLRVAALHMRAELTRAKGEYGAAVPLYEQLLSADEERCDDGSCAMEHYNLASVYIQTGALDLARTHLRRSLALCPARPGQIRYTLLGYAGWLARAGDPETAGRVLGAVEAHLQSIGEILDPAEALELTTHVEAGMARDAPAFDSGRRAGRTMPIEEAQALVADV